MLISLTRAAQSNGRHRSVLGCPAMSGTDAANAPEIEPGGDDSPAERVEYVAVDDLRADDDTTTCLRPLGLCELGGACDACWYRPDHPRFKK